MKKVKKTAVSLAVQEVINFFQCNVMIELLVLKEKKNAMEKMD